MATKTQQPPRTKVSAQGKVVQEAAPQQKSSLGSTILLGLLAGGAALLMTGSTESPELEQEKEEDSSPEPEVTAEAEPLKFFKIIETDGKTSALWPGRTKINLDTLFPVLGRIANYGFHIHRPRENAYVVGFVGREMTREEWSKTLASGHAWSTETIAEFFKIVDANVPILKLEISAQAAPSRSITGGHVIRFRTNIGPVFFAIKDKGQLVEINGAWDDGFTYNRPTVLHKSAMNTYIREILLNKKDTWPGYEETAGYIESVLRVHLRAHPAAAHELSGTGYVAQIDRVRQENVQANPASLVDQGPSSKYFGHSSMKFHDAAGLPLLEEAFKREGEDTFCLNGVPYSGKNLSMALTMGQRGLSQAEADAVVNLLKITLPIINVTLEREEASARWWGKATYYFFRVNGEKMHGFHVLDHEDGIEIANSLSSSVKDTRINSYEALLTYMKSVINYDISTDFIHHRVQESIAEELARELWKLLKKTAKVNPLWN